MGAIYVSLPYVTSQNMAHMQQMQQNYAHGRFGEERTLKIIAMVRSPQSERKLHTALTKLAMLLQTTFIANAVADVLIAGTMVYHVNLFRLR
jgi:hypothetical protein